MQLNQEWFKVLQDENPVGLACQIKLLESLGSHPRLIPLLASIPKLLVYSGARP